MGRVPTTARRSAAARPGARGWRDEHHRLHGQECSSSFRGRHALEGMLLQETDICQEGVGSIHGMLVLRGCVEHLLAVTRGRRRRGLSGDDWLSQGWAGSWIGTDQDRAG